MSQDWETVEVTATSTEADLICGFLAHQGVTVEKESRLFTQEPVSFGALGDVRVCVPTSEADRARQLLAELRDPGSGLAEEPALEPPVETESIDETTD